MSLVVNTNVGSLNAQRSLAASGAELKTAMERLSSGSKINSASDDAAGFAIAERMTAQIRGLNMAAKNAGDGLSMLSAIENATNDVTDMLQRMRELAVQAVNDTNTQQDREYLQGEVSALVAEIDRVATQTQYNGQSILDGSMSGKIQVGTEAGQTVEFAIGSIKSDDLGSSSSGPLLSSQSWETTNGGYTHSGNNDYSNPTTESNAKLDSVWYHYHDGARGEGHVYTRGQDTPLGGGSNASNNWQYGSYAAQNLEVGDTVSYGDHQYTVTFVEDRPWNPSDVTNTGDSLIKISDPNRTFSYQADQILYKVESEVNGSFRNSNEVMAATYGLEVGDTIQFRKDSNNLTEEVSDAYLIQSIDGSFGPDFEGVITLSSALSQSDQSLISNHYTDVFSAKSSLADIDLTEDASGALATITAAIEQVAGNRAEYGALQNRLEYTVSNLMNVSEFTTAARSRIADADFAAESARLAKAQVLQQSGTAMLAQANASSQLALSLIR